MQQERMRPVSPLSFRSARKTFWLTVLGFGVLLVPVELLLIMNSGKTFFLQFPWNTLSSFFVAGVLCAFIIIRRMESRGTFDFLLVGCLSGLCTSLLCAFLWLVIILVNGIIGIYHPAPRVISGMAPMFHESWGLLVLIIGFFMAIASFHVVAASLGGLLSGLFKACLAKLAATNRG